MEYMKDDPCKVCDFGFIVSLEWWESWVKYATDQSGTVQKPYKMGNDKHLFSFEITIKEYKVIHPKAWDVFKETYDFRPELLAFKQAYRLDRNIKKIDFEAIKILLIL